MSGEDSYESSMADAYLDAFEAAQDAGEFRYRFEEEGITALESIADSLSHLTSMNKAQVDSATRIHEKLNDMGNGRDIDEDYILSGVESLLNDYSEDTDSQYPGGGRRRRTRTGSGPSANFNFGEQEISGGFDPWANFNFGDQDVSDGWSDWSDYNFGWDDSDEESGNEGGSSDWWDEFEPGWSGPVINNNQNRVVNRINILDPE